ncbi:putative insertion sequence transposase protein [Stappia aggregata IAM 12614]|uniref:Putative insertion sequence transposase protein n=1 Tax=Roseibium aggregatum (strain ATCC 25650 / DSM 13394 / JCM 20685 / NBRC 16684 / NCIMB 2208 / IAM 12614 / B1) TaxID=384765 RepID=A0P226_ROSAI|nr:putative insertion sequence transposase protein [Stappia aggregata IAM 12614] [Roseibium aggregatum IAM 12614]
MRKLENEQHFLRFRALRQTNPPQTNGKAERFIKTLQEEWAYGVPYKTSEQRNAALPRWLGIYNCQRPHGGINFKTPITRLTLKQ